LVWNSIRHCQIISSGRQPPTLRLSRNWNNAWPLLSKHWMRLISRLIT
jgi:hypothetical protein